MSAEMDDGRRDMRLWRRTLRFLLRGEARLRTAAMKGIILLDGDKRGVISLPEQMLKEFERRGDIAIEGKSVRLEQDAKKRAPVFHEKYCDNKELERQCDSILTHDTLGHSGAACALAGNPGHGLAGVKPALDETAPCPLLARKQEVESIEMRTEEGTTKTVSINMAESPLAMLWRRKAKSGERFLTASEFQAGERLRTDYTHGQIMPHMGINWSSVGGSGQRLGAANGMAQFTDMALAARQRVEKAIDSVGPELAGVLIDICCFLKGLEQVETERGWPARSAKVVLKSALAALARHYEPQRAARGGKILHWGADDYRPSLK